jgi:beta-aspartyl-peptidase (threonine type)
VLIKTTSQFPYALIIHGGAGGRSWVPPKGTVPGADERPQLICEGLIAAYQAGEAVLAAGGSALDAVCAAVCSLEDTPVFNAGRGAGLTHAGEVEHDAAVMTGAGQGGAVAVSRHVRHPVLYARKVMEESPSVLLADPPDSYAENWGLELVPNEWFITDYTRAYLSAIQQGNAEKPKHGTVGAVALDASGQLAAATSTGGFGGKPVARVGDTPILGAGTWAENGVVAVSGTGHGEAFIQGAVAHDIAARIKYLGTPLPEAVETTMSVEIGGRDSLGGIIALGPDGNGAIVWNSDLCLCAWRDGDEIKTMWPEDPAL